MQKERAVRPDTAPDAVQVGKMASVRCIRGDAFAAPWPEILDDRKIDLLMLDPPYGTTDLRWDACVNLEGLCRILHPHLAEAAWIFLWGPMELAAALVSGGRYRRKFEYIWTKPPAMRTRNVVRPLIAHDICWALIRADLERRRDLYFDAEALRTVGKPYVEKRSSLALGEGSYYAESGNSTEIVPWHNWGYREGTTVLRAPSKRSMPLRERAAHPTQKPLAVLERILRGYCPPGGLAVDPMCGSGSTLLAAANAGRDCVGIEKEAKYVEAYLSRIPDIPPPTEPPKADAAQRRLFE